MAGVGRSLATSVLFACSQNSIRSPMAAAIARHYFGKRMLVESAGVELGQLDPFAVAVMAELGIDIANYRPKTLGEVSEVTFDLIITLSPEAHHRALDLGNARTAKVEYWPTRDPSIALELGYARGAILDSYRNVRDFLSERILARLSAGPVGTL